MVDSNYISQLVSVNLGGDPKEAAPYKDNVFNQSKAETDPGAAWHHKRCLLAPDHKYEKLDHKGPITKSQCKQTCVTYKKEEVWELSSLYQIASSKCGCLLLTAS